MDKKTRATLDDLIAAKLQKDKDKMQVKEIEIPSLGKTLLFKAPNDKQIIDFMNQSYGKNDFSLVYEAYKKIIYLSCDELQNQELINACEVNVLFDVIEKIMDGNDIMVVGDEICSMNRMYGNLENEIKNS